MPAASGNEKFAILERRKRVSDLYLRGKSQWQIARELEMNQATVSRDLAALRGEWREANAFQIDELQQRELAKIDLLEAEAWLAWERSKENKERTTKERSSGEVSAKSKVVVVTEGRLPDNEFLKTVQWCINKRCEILGLDAPKKLEHSGELDIKMSEADKMALIGSIAAKLGAMADDRDHEDDAEDNGGMGADSAAGAGLGAGGAAPDPDGDGDRP